MLSELDKKTRAMLSKVLASLVKVGGTIRQPVWQAEIGMTDVPNELECLSIQARRGVPITFTEEDMLIEDIQPILCQTRPYGTLSYPSCHLPTQCSDQGESIEFAYP